MTHAAAWLFVSAATGDLHLRPTASAAIDQAVAISTPVPWDIDGQPRGASADVGADEYSAAAELLPPSGLTVASLVGNTVTLVVGGPERRCYANRLSRSKEGRRLARCWPACPRGVDADDNVRRAERDLLRPRPRDGRRGEKRASNEVQLLVNVTAPPAAPTGLLGLANGDQLP